MEPIIVVAMQYWLEAWTDELAVMAHTGSTRVKMSDRATRVLRKPFRFSSSVTGCAMFSELGLAEIVSTLEQALIRGSESQGVIRKEQSKVPVRTDMMSF